MTSDLEKTMATYDVTSGSRTLGCGETLHNICVTEGVEQEIAFGLGSKAF